MAKNKGGISTVKSDDDWEVESALSCLLRAREIRKDKKLMAKVTALAQKKVAEVAGVAGESEEDC